MIIIILKNLRVNYFLAKASLDNFVNNYLRVVKKCSEQDKCFADSYRSWNGRENVEDIAWTNDYAYVLADGSAISIYYYGDKEGPGPIQIYIDVNGKKGPNRVGYDLWSMDIFYDGTVDESTEYNLFNDIDSIRLSHEAREYRYEKCVSGTYGGCFGHFLENGFKFDY